MSRDPDAFSAGLVQALRAALAGRSDVQERLLFGSLCFMVDGKLCLGVKRDELLVRLPPARHDEFLEHQGTRELSPHGGMQGYFFIAPDGYARRAQWEFWINQALAYNPQARATPPRKAASTALPREATSTALPRKAASASAPRKPSRPRRHILEN